MKNIHLIPTDKPTGIFKSGDNLLFSITHKVRTNHEGFDIYITSDEEIKKGDWFYASDRNTIHKNQWKGDLKYEFSFYYKIILTTDQDLIKDGVQPITNTFAEWFVKNPSCEEVEVESGLFFYADGEDRRYKITIPKEEPKQETLEEAAERIYPTTIDSFTDNGFDLSERERLIFVNGAKWQGERMYSKEDMECAFKSSSLTNVLDVYESFEEFIEGFKKK